MTWINFISSLIIIFFLLDKKKSMLCLSFKHKFIRYASKARLNKQQKEQNQYIKKNFFYGKRFVFILSKKVYNLNNKSSLPSVSIKINKNKNFNCLKKVIEKNLVPVNYFSLYMKNFFFPYCNKKKLGFVKMSSINESKCNISIEEVTTKNQQTKYNESILSENDNKTNPIHDNFEKTNSKDKSNNVEYKIDTPKEDKNDIIKKRTNNHLDNLSNSKNISINSSNKKLFVIDTDKCKDDTNITSKNANGDENYKIYNIQELENMRKNSNFFKLNSTENDEFSIELYFNYKELKFLRKKEENLKSLINRLTLNLKKLEKKKKQLNKKKNKNKEQTEDSPNKTVNSIQFFDSENNLIDENDTLKDIADKLNYVIIDNLKISIFKDLYDLKQIYVSMDVYNNHPIIPVNLPLDKINEYVYYWIDSTDKNVVKSYELFYIPNKDEISKKIQLVIYDKKNPFFFYVTEQTQVNHNEFEEELIIKGNRYIDFKKTHDDNNNIIRIMSYNILAPIYTNTKYAMEYMFKNIEPRYLKTNYRSHLLIYDINYDLDIISLQEVSEYLHSNLFTVYLHEKFYSYYKPKSNHGNDGCSLFVNKKKFSLIEHRNYEFSEVIKKKELKDVYDVFINLSENLEEIINGIKTVFQIGIYLHKNTQCVFIIANTHFYFHSLADHIRAMQSYSILYILHTLKNECEQKYLKTAYVILNGDFNTTFDSDVFHFFEGKDITSNSEIWKNAKLFKKEFDDLNKYPKLFDLKNTYSSHDINGPFLNRKKFLSLYSAYKKKDISYTNWNNNFIEVLDHIFLSPDIKVRKILKGIDQNNFAKYKGLVSPIHPSDHLPIAAEIEI
ncbi:endonuclease/exonuclease/phosphatase family protein, putative [Plasmodium gallinaceum]|uniref:Endonuclease/exonuclease/phosphatase family protein, putative n=1 Tax=Plasmodium gallinaceum TaxID=5849 RepID=A0A1J1GT89_PLAGA|nr:endonuclease/exonuclease/phosphatase family protein, putative [Plasmodium gallinaceum]CRG94267.1 endonuclease/exonuclease/phosphatase family protein, putative [Plasmodium gallinaceum]